MEKLPKPASAETVVEKYETVLGEPRLSQKMQVMVEVLRGKGLLDEANEMLALAQEAAALEEISRTDELTGLLNRRAFREGAQRLEAVFERERHNQKVDVPSALLAVDLDGFKEVNDVGGHACGDRCLKLIAERVSAALRESDIFARVGGDEFSVFLPDSDEVGATHVANKVRSVIETEVVEVLRREFPSYKGSLSASIGIVALGGAGETEEKERLTVDQAMKYADYASYVVKAAGKKSELTLAEARQLDADGQFERDFLSGKDLPR